ncbi:MAG: alpha/beta hydrolase [Steroidobacteraceae bacterium]
MSRTFRPVRLVIGVAVVVAVLGIAFVTGPVHELNPASLPHARDLPPLSEVDRWVADREAMFSDVVPGTEKTVIWAGERNRRTRYAIVYLHGYTATRQEVAPLCDLLAAELGANLFYTRLAGHGRHPAALGAVDGSEWLRDAEEALLIGRTLGERVIVVGTSTGGTLALWLAQQRDAQAIAALLLISPNLGPRNRQGELLAGPWGETLLRLLVGDTYEWQPANAAQSRYWTWRYPSQALLPMMALVRLVRDSPLESIRIPTLVLYSRDDQVVHPEQIELAYARLGASNKTLQQIDTPQDRSRHILAGDILAPRDTPRTLALMREFLARLGIVAEISRGA